MIAARAVGNNAGKLITHAAIGTGSRKETEGDPSLANEITPSSGNRIAISDVGTATSFGSQIRVQMRLSRSLYSGTGAIEIREAGLFDSASGGNLLARVTLKSPIRLTTGNPVLITVTSDITPRL